MTVDFEWDDSKNQHNFKKHGIWFEEAQTIWTDAQAVEFFDPEHSKDEDRFILDPKPPLNCRVLRKRWETDANYFSQKNYQKRAETI